MEIFVINLKRSPVRRQRMERQLNRLGLAYKILDACDGYLLSPEEIATHVDPHHQFHRPFSNAEVGCFMSHYQALQRIVDQQLPYALILEDDVRLSPTLPWVLSHVQDMIRPGQTVSLYAALPGPSRFTSTRRLDEHYALTEPSADTLVVGNQAYVVTLEAARQLVANMYPMHIHCDQWSFFKQQGYVQSFEVVFPHPVDISGDYSDIHESYGGPLLRLKKALIRYVPAIGNIILRKRRAADHATRRANILLDGQAPRLLFR